MSSRQITIHQHRAPPDPRRVWARKAFARMVTGIVALMATCITIQAPAAPPPDRCPAPPQPFTCTSVSSASSTIDATIDAKNHTVVSNASNSDKYDLAFDVKRKWVCSKRLQLDLVDGRSLRYHTAIAPLRINIDALADKPVARYQHLTFDLINGGSETLTFEKDRWQPILKLHDTQTVPYELINGRQRLTIVLDRGGPETRDFVIPSVDYSVLQHVRPTKDGNSYVFKYTPIYSEGENGPDTTYTFSRFNGTLKRVYDGGSMKWACRPGNFDPDTAPY
jgi:hypothetical protein